MKYTIAFLSSVKKDMRRIPVIAVEKIQHALRSLQEDPFPMGVQPIHGYEHTYRIRVGQYRIVYEVAMSVRIITVVRIGHRKDVYRRL